MSIYDEDPVADALRRAANGDEAARSEFHNLRAARVRARRELEHAGHARARTMLNS